MLLYIHKIKKENDKKYAKCILLGNEHYMFEILGHDGYIFGEIIESIYPGEEPVEGPLDILKPTELTNLVSCPHTTQ